MNQQDALLQSTAPFLHTCLKLYIHTHTHTHIHTNRIQDALLATPTANLKAGDVPLKGVLGHGRTHVDGMLAITIPFGRHHIGRGDLCDLLGHGLICVCVCVCVVCVC